MLEKLITGIVFSTAALVVNAAPTPYTLVVPFPPGGASDTFARIMAKELNEELKVPVIVENRPGAAGVVGATYFARLPKNTRSIFLGTVSTHAINPSLYKDIKYNAVTDFTPVAMVFSQPNMLAVNAETNIKSVDDLIAEGKKRNLNYGSSGVGTSAHLSAEIMGKTHPEMQINHVPYKGGSPAIIDLLGGRLDFVFDNISSILPHIQSGKLRGLAVTSSERSSQAPTIPTMNESGFKDFDATAWFGFWLPKESDQAMVIELSNAFEKIYKKPEFKKTIIELGASPTLRVGKNFTSFLAGEQKRWKRVLEKLDVKI